MTCEQGHVLINELNSAFSYLARLIAVSTKLSTQVPFLNQVKENLTQGIRSLLHELQTELSLHSLMQDLPNRDLLELEQTYIQGQKLIKYALELKLSSDRLPQLCVRVINDVYERCFQLHLLCDPQDRLKIQLPRVTVIRVYPREQNLDNSQSLAQQHSIPKFYFPLENIPVPSEIEFISLEKNRKLRYDFFIKAGHEYVHQKNYAKALRFFQKAQDLISSAEALTLIGHVHSLMGDFTKAKEYCFEAIKKDPDYGNPYNDIGSYLLSEGKVKESFSWFQLAKKAKYYLNREFPYINSARAHLILKNYKEAMQEFMKAVEFVPYHKDLQRTVQRLKSLTHKHSHSKENNSTLQ